MKYIKNILLLLSLCLSFLLLLFYAYKEGYRKFFSIEQHHLQEIFYGNSYNDILFLGSSRTFYHVNPSVIDSVTSLRSYNAGLEGVNVLEMNLVLKSYLKSHKPPKIAVFDFANTAFAIAFKPIYNPNIYYPHLDNEQVFTTLKPYKRVYLLKYLPFTQLTEADDLLRQGAIMGYLGKKKIATEQYYKGYYNKGADTIKLPFKRRYRTTFYDVDEKGKQILTEMIQTCQRNNIQVVFTYAPVYRKNDEELNPEFFKLIHDFSSIYNIPFFNYRNIAISTEHRYFMDEQHLNDQGVTVYSNMLANDLKYLNKNPSVNSK